MKEINTLCVCVCVHIYVHLWVNKTRKLLWNHVDICHTKIMDFYNLMFYFSLLQFIVIEHILQFKIKDRDMIYLNIFLHLPVASLLLQQLLKTHEAFGQSALCKFKYNYYCFSNPKPFLILLCSDTLTPKIMLYLSFFPPKFCTGLWTNTGLLLRPDLQSKVCI